MSDIVRYLHFGPQCPGWAYMEQGAREAARILDLPFEVRDVSREPELAREYNMFFPGMIVVGNLHIVYPGTGEQIAESIRLRGPLLGKHDYQQLPAGRLDRVELLTPGNLESIQGICIPTHMASGWKDKEKWLQEQDTPVLGVVGYSKEQPVAVMEVLPRELVPYPVPQEGGLFVTCLYGKGGDVDYRPGLLERGLPLLRAPGEKEVGIVAGVKRPYPNGPVELLARAGFREQADLGEVVLRHCREKIVYMSRSI